MPIVKSVKNGITGIMSERKRGINMKIKEIDFEHILFDNGSKITFDHDQNCCEWNYADFEQLKDTVAMDIDFDENLIFEGVDEAGFRFGNKENMFFVPCYSEQNGYYWLLIYKYFITVKKF